MAGDSITTIALDKNIEIEDRIESLNRVVWNDILFQNPDSAIKLIEPTLDVSSETNIDEHLESINILGVAAAVKGNFPKSLDYFLEGLNKIGDTSRIKTKIKFIGNVSNVYRELSEFEDAEKYLIECIKLQESINDSFGLANSISNLAGLFNEQNKYDEAIKYAHIGMKLHLRLNNMMGYARFLHNISLIYIELGIFDSAIYYNKLSLPIRDSINDIFGVVSSNIGLGQAYNGMGEYKKGLEHCLSIQNQLNKVNSVQQRAYYCQCLEESYKGLKDYKKAYFNRVRFDSLQTLVDGDDARKKVMQSKYMYELEKQHIKDSLIASKNESIQKIKFDKKIKTRNAYTYAVGVVAILLVMFLWFVYSRLKITRLQKQQIEDAKNEIETKSKEINASITYAKRIQSAVFPEIRLEDLFPNSFLIYKPKDVVSGDFYWWEKADNKILFAVADCTGHGVPGGFMSMLGSIFANEIFNSKKIYQPSKILDELSNLMKISLKNDKGETIKDGMDISFASLNTKTLELEWAGANNPLFIIRNNELEVIKGNRQPVGHFHQPEVFTHHSVQLQKGDKIYLFSDGFADQFGGDHNKKIGIGRFKEMLLRFTDLKMKTQQNELERFFNDWKGGEEQIDDVCVLGVEI